jgi:hypothetical protein
MEVERFELLAEGIDVHHLGEAAVDLAVVVVDDHAEVVELIMRGGHHGLPDRSLLQLAVAGERVDARAVLIDELVGHCHADGDRETLAERAAARLDAGEPHVPSGMSLKAAAELAERQELRLREEARVGEGGVEDRAHMAGGEDKAVPAGLVRILGIVIHDAAEVEDCEYIARAEGAAGVSRFRLDKGADDITTDLVRYLGELFGRVTFVGKRHGEIESVS